MKNWGWYQRECHRMLDELFPLKKDGYKWLKDNFQLSHFSQLKHPVDEKKLIAIYEKLYTLSFNPN